MYITVMSPALWPLGGHTIGPHHITAAVKNSQNLGKRGKKHRGGWTGGWGRRARKEESLRLGGRVTKTKPEPKNKVYHRTKTTGLEKSWRVRREREKKEKKK